MRASNCLWNQRDLKCLIKSSMFLQLPYYMNAVRIASILPCFCLLVSNVLLNMSAHQVLCRPVATLTKGVSVCRGPFVTHPSPYPLLGTSGVGTHFPIYLKKNGYEYGSWM